MTSPSKPRATPVRAGTPGGTAETSRLGPGTTGLIRAFSKGFRARVPCHENRKVKAGEGTRTLDIQLGKRHLHAAEIPEFLEDSWDSNPLGRDFKPLQSISFFLEELR
jgi:hypothetical protein